MVTKIHMGYPSMTLVGNNGSPNGSKNTHGVPQYDTSRQ